MRRVERTRTCYIHICRPCENTGALGVSCKVVGGSPMLFWLVDGVVSSIVEIWVLGQWTKNNEEIVRLRSSLMDAMTPNIHRMIFIW